MSAKLDELEKKLETKFKKTSRRLFFIGLFLGLGISITSTVIAVSGIGNHDHFITQILGSNRKRINIDTKKLNAMDCIRSKQKSSDDDSSINNAENCWEVSTRTGTPTNFVGDITYIDLRTGFEWSSMISDTNGMTLATAISNCDSANIRGFTDWRLPAMSEYIEAFAHGYYEVAAGTDEDGDGSLTDNWDTDGNEGINDEFLWSQTTQNAVITRSQQFSLDTMSGANAVDTSSSNGEGGPFSARCVR